MGIFYRVAIGGAFSADACRLSIVAERATNRYLVFFKYCLKCSCADRECGADIFSWYCQ